MVGKTRCHHPIRYADQVNSSNDHRCFWSASKHESKVSKKLAATREIYNITLHHDLHSRRQGQDPIAAGDGHMHHVSFAEESCPGGRSHDGAKGRP